MVLVMTMEYLYCKATGQEMEERKRWFQFWKDDNDDTDDDDSTSSSKSTIKDKDSSEQSIHDDNNIRVLNLNLPSDSDKKLGNDQITTVLHKGWYVESLSTGCLRNETSHTE